MTVETTPRSAYPARIATLLPKARELVAELGELPSRNRLMTELRIGAPKANALLDALQTPEPGPAEQAPTRLHLVPTELTTNSAEPATDPTPAPLDTATPAEQANPPLVAPVQVNGAVDPDTSPAAQQLRPVRSWPVLLLAAPAFVAIWSGWVGLGGLTGFGIVRPLPGIWDGLQINTAITLPIGVETYAAFALRAWLSGHVPAPARQFAKWSAIGSLALGALGQIAYHLMSAADVTAAPWWITTLVACLPVAVLGMGAALAHLLHDDTSTETDRTPHHA